MTPNTTKSTPEPSAGIRFVPEIGKTIEVTFNYTKHSQPQGQRKKEIENFYQTLLKEINNLQIENIIDIGCGEGFTLDRIQKSSINKELVGIDSSLVAVNLGKELFPQLDLRLGNIYQLPFPDKSFDLVVCTEVLEHLENPSQALQEIVRMAKKYIILSVPHEPFFSLRNILQGKHLKRLGNTPGHINWWTEAKFKKFVEKENITILKTRHPFPFTMVIGIKK
ncbi:MAG: class I SAM-dependent methyltransferase [Patescibacteria group bacterium]|jgi:ubiquinone/menaquinone biosynthesis C-methylase UbiE